MKSLLSRCAKTLVREEICLHSLVFWVVPSAVSPIPSRRHL